MAEKIVIGCDNAAVAYRDEIKQMLLHLGYDVVDVGVDSQTSPTFYPYVAEAAAKEIQKDPDNIRGILICGTGIGMAMTANKCKGIRAAVGHDSFSVERSRLSNDSNVLCMGARVIGIELAKMLTKQWLSLGHVTGASKDKVEAILEIERANFK